MTLRPWRDIVAPHKDVLEGTFEEAKFAADLTKVVSGTAAPEYQDPALFFERTFITEGMGLLLTSVVKRLAGRGGDPVVQLQTSFGGGKTHTMMAVWHAVSAREPASHLAGISPILDRAGVTDLPRGRVAVIDGNALSPSQPREHGTVTANTLWGEMAWQLGREAGYDLVAAADRDGTSPGKQVLQTLFERFAPCVVLMDETVAYMRQFAPGQRYAGGTYNSNLSFVQALTEAAAGVPSAMVLASLPESMMEAGDQLGRDTLEALEKVFGRIEAVWKPVATEEAFEIVRRRLFGPVRDEAARDAVCRAFAAMYQGDRDKFPVEAGDGGYERRLRASYPVHPEIFERLYEDWSTLPRFQRTRGVLRLMAHILHSLWRADNRDLLVLPGSIPLDDLAVRSELIKYLPHGWDPIVDKDVDGVRAQPRLIDDGSAALGSVQASRRAARTIFLGSAPSVAEQKVRGIGIERVRLGCAQPEQAIGRYDDALRRLGDRLHYLYSGNDRYWFDLRPNLRREMEDRMQRFDEVVDLYPELSKRLDKALGSGVWARAHVFRGGQDVPDGADLRLVVLDPGCGGHKRKQSGSGAVAAAGEVLQRHGERIREWQNRLLFLAPDRDSLGALRDQVRRLLAWQSIVEDIEVLNLDPHHQKEAKKNRDKAEERLGVSLREVYRWLLVPVVEVGARGQLSEVIWEEAELDLHGTGYGKAIGQVVEEREWVIGRWAPMFLRDVLVRWYWKEGRSEAGVMRVWDDCGKHLYLPRLGSRAVFEQAVQDGVEVRDYFAYAAGVRADGGYEGMVFGRSGGVYMEEGAVLIEPGAAAAWQERAAASAGGGTGVGTAAGTGVVHGTDGGGGVAPVRGESGVGERVAGGVKRRFHATVELSPLTAVMQLEDIMNEVIERFTDEYGTQVNITVDIEAERGAGFDAKLQRTVKENCATLKFKLAEFEEE